MDAARFPLVAQLALSRINFDDGDAGSVLIARLQRAGFELLHVVLAPDKSLLAEAPGDPRDMLGVDRQLGKALERFAGLLERTRIASGVLDLADQAGAVALSPEIQSQIPREKKISGRACSSTRAG